MTLGSRLGLSLRTGWRRSSVLFWSATLAIAGATGLFVSSQAGTAVARAQRLGGLREVPVAARPLAAGRVLRPADVSVRRLPAAAVPVGRLARSPVGRTTVVPLAAGEVVLAEKLAPDGVRGVAALLPAGMRALAVPVDTAALALEPGHHVDVLATFDTELGGGTGGADPASDPNHDAYAAGAPTFAVASGALVLAAGEESATVAVSPEEAPRVAFAIARGTVTLALTEGPRNGG
ncbi:MAG TPA: Flp pilus assembly protein CpaB [Acidimicrobiales bacterium]|nr:Flp pilus assembly protein CpaB [Acidimicrobiales bacterium]